MDPSTPRHPDPLALLRQCEAAAIEREGVAMFVGVHDARPGAPGLPEGAGPTAAVDPVLRGEAVRLRELFDAYTAALAPDRDERRPSPDPTGGGWSLIEVLVVMSEQHLRAPVGLVGPSHPDHRTAPWSVS